MSKEEMTDPNNDEQIAVLATKEDLLNMIAGLYVKRDPDKKVDEMTAPELLKVYLHLKHTINGAV